MNQAVSSIAQLVGRIAVILAIVLLVWSVADIVNEPAVPGNVRPTFGPNRYITALAQSAGLAVSGMLAIALGAMLEHFTAAEPHDRQAASNV